MKIFSSVKRVSCLIWWHWSSLDAFILSVRISPFACLRTVTFRSSFMSNCMVEMVFRVLWQVSSCFIADFIDTITHRQIQLPGSSSSRPPTLLPFLNALCLLKRFDDAMHLNTMPFELLCNVLNRHRLLVICYDFVAQFLEYHFS